jgi:hypothetical protein
VCIVSRKKSYGKLQSHFLSVIFRYPETALLSHWAFQGLFYMGWTERLFKIGLELLLIVLFALVLQAILKWQAALFVSFLIVHTLNFLFNGQLWAALKCFDLVQTPDDKFLSYVDALAHRARREPSIQALMVYGSLARNERTLSSDFDARIVRKPGFINGVRACVFLLCERSRALLTRFPLDMYIVDTPLELKKLRVDEQKQAVDLIAHTKVVDNRS